MLRPLPGTVRGWMCFTFSIIVFAAALLLNLSAYTKASLRTVEWRDSDFSYVESDYPATLFPLSQHPRDASLVIEESVHYLPNNSREWASLFPESGGFVRLGPRGRMFKVSMFHQLHCLDAMRGVVAEPVSGAGVKLHAQHCLNYLREMLLCASSTRLEAMKKTEGMGDMAEKVDGLGLEHQCRDWSLLWRKVDENFAGWIGERD